MKRQLIFVSLLAGLLGLSWRLPAQDAAATAAREEAEARYTRINTRVQELEETIQAHQKTIMKLTEELHRLNEEVDRLKNKNENAATQESIKRLAEKIEEVDKKRQADNELVVAQLKALGKAAAVKPAVSDKPAPIPSGPKPPSGTPANSGSPGAAPGGATATVPENGYEYAIKKGDTLDKILRDLRAINIKITEKQATDANPGVNWNKLKIGQKIFIPAPVQ